MKIPQLNCLYRFLYRVCVNSQKRQIILAVIGISHDQELVGFRLDLG